MANPLTRELRVAFSRRVQPWWVRVLKWTVLIGGAVALFPTNWFWAWVLGLPALGLIVHFFYRWKTHGWARPWGGWDDLDSGR